MPLDCKGAGVAAIARLLQNPGAEEAKPAVGQTVALDAALTDSSSAFLISALLLHSTSFPPTVFNTESE